MGKIDTGTTTVSVSHSDTPKGVAGKRTTLRIILSPLWHGPQQWCGSRFTFIWDQLNFDMKRSPHEILNSFFKRFFFIYRYQFLVGMDTRGLSVFTNQEYRGKCLLLTCPPIYYCFILSLSSGISCLAGFLRHNAHIVSWQLWEPLFISRSNHKPVAGQSLKQHRHYMQTGGGGGGESRGGSSNRLSRQKK